MHPNVLKQINQCIVETPLRSLSEACNVNQSLCEPTQIILFHLPYLTRQRLKQFGLVGMGLLSVLLTPVPTKAAETISFVYSPFQESLSVQSLEELGIE